MDFTRLSDDMKLAVMKKMNYNTVNQFRLCNRHNSSLVSRFSTSFECNKSVYCLIYRSSNVLSFGPSGEGEGADIQSLKVEEAARVLHSRTAQSFVVKDLDGIVTFCQDSNISAQSILFDSINNNWTQLEDVLFLLRPIKLTFTTNMCVNASCAGFNQIKLPEESISLYITSSPPIGSRHRCQLDVPVGIRTMIVKGVALSENSLNLAFKRWFRGVQTIHMYTSDNFKSPNTYALFDGICLKAWTGAPNSVRTIIHSWLGEVKERGSQLRYSPYSIYLKCEREKERRFIIWRLDQSFLKVEISGYTLTITGPSYHQNDVTCR